MAIEKLNARRVETIKADGGKMLEVRDEIAAGLMLRVMSSGLKTWSFAYARSSDGRNRRARLGHFPAKSLEDARRDAAAMRRVVDDGGDPAGEAQAKKTADTFAELAGAWVKRQIEANYSEARAYDVRLMLDKDLLPALGQMKADAVTGKDIRRVLDKVLDRGSSVRANRVLSAVRAIYTWGRGQQRTAIDPTLGLAKPTKEKPRDRILSGTEIAAFWAALPRAKMSEGNRLAYRLLLATAQRESAVAEAAKMWVIPRERTKSKRDDHRVPLSALAVNILDAAFALAGDSPWVFPSVSRKGEAKPIDGHDLNKAMQRARQASIWGIPYFTTHDLRRTAATTLGDLGFEDFIIGHVLDHAGASRGTITGRVYNRAKYDPQKRQALDALGAHIETLVGIRQPATNVVAFPASASA